MGCLTLLLCFEWKEFSPINIHMGVVFLKFLMWRYLENRSWIWGFHQQHLLLSQKTQRYGFWSITQEQNATIWKRDRVYTSWNIIGRYLHLKCPIIGNIKKSVCAWKHLMKWYCAKDTIANTWHSKNVVALSTKTDSAIFANSNAGYSLTPMFSQIPWPPSTHNIASGQQPVCFVLF